MIESSGATLGLLTRLHRPRLLVRAARAGLTQYDRSRDLGRILRGPAPEAGPAALAALLAEEAAAETRRTTGDVTYDVAHHIELLIGLMGEARQVPRPSGEGT